jgi:hypothetical protein
MCSINLPLQFVDSWQIHCAFSWHWPHQKSWTVQVQGAVNSDSELNLIDLIFRMLLSNIDLPRSECSGHVRPCYSCFGSVTNGMVVLLSRSISVLFTQEAHPISRGWSHGRGTLWSHDLVCERGSHMSVHLWTPFRDGRGNRLAT